MSKGLHFDAVIATAYSLQGLAVILSSLVVGALADRCFSAQKLLGVLALASALFLYILGQITTSEPLFLFVLLVHLCLYTPTIPLTNTIAFGNMTDAPRQFARVRLFGTLGWIVTGVVVGTRAGAAATVWPIHVATFLGAALGLYAFSLPDTPPAASVGAQRMSVSRLLGLDVLREVKGRSFWAFALASLVIMTPISFYFAYSNAFLDAIKAHVTLLGQSFEPAAIQTLGQVSEILCLLILPSLLLRFGIKAVIVMGMAAWGVRYLLFAFGAPESGPIMSVLIISILLHGVCQDFFLVAGQIYMNVRFPAEARARAQSFFMVLTAGFGALIGSNVAGVVFNMTAGASGPNWMVLWLVSAAVGFCALLLFGVLFNERKHARVASAAH